MKLLYQFEASDSFLHALDPRTKLVVVLCYLILTFLAPWPWAMALVAMALIWVFGKISPAEYYPILLFFLPIMIAITIVQVFFVGGEPYRTIGIGGTTVGQFSLKGWQEGTTIAWRLAAMGIAFLMFSMTTDPFDWGLSLHNMGLPYKAAFLFAFAMRFFPLLQEEMVTIQSAFKARGADALSSWNPYRFLVGVAQVVFPLGASALRRSQNIALAMELRGFSFPEITGTPRVISRQVRLRLVDWMVMVGATSTVIVTVALKTLSGS
jgi:energy-coupling factor transport system permease protein